MNPFFRKCLLVFPVAACLAFTSGQPDRPRAEIALVIDLSGSTNGLLDDVRDNLWNFVNGFQAAYPEYDLRLGIVGYSRGSFGAENAYVKVLSDLTTQYDFLSYSLFNMVSYVEKGDQYVGAAVKTAVDGLSWTKDGTRKVMLLFGNSSAALGTTNYLQAAERASEKHITIHSIYCSRGNDNPRYLSQWYALANRTGGGFFKMLVTHRSPDKLLSANAQTLVDWNNTFNDTYVPYSREGSVNYNLMLAADVNALQMHEKYFYARCLHKISPAYRSYLASFDLVSYAGEHQALPPVNRRYLPDGLAETTSTELLQIAKIKAERRAAVLQHMQESLVVKNDPQAVNPIDSIFMATLSASN